MMPEYTANYNLIKPGYDETADIKVINENMDTLDTAIKAVEDKAETVSKVVLITEPFDQVTDTTVNLGFRPKLVTIVANIIGTTYESTGYVEYVDGSTSNNYCIRTNVDANTRSLAGGGIRFYYNGNNYLDGDVTITETGLKIEWTLNGTLTGASGNRRLLISAITHGEV